MYRATAWRRAATMTIIKVSRWCERCVIDSVEGLGDGGGGCGGLLPSVERHDIGVQRRGRGQVDPSARPDHAAHCPRHQEPLRDTLGPREHQPFHAGALETAET